MIPQIYLLYSLVFLETGFIFYSYFGLIGWGTSFPSIFYLLLALVDINSISRKFAILVLLTTFGISVPRILIKMDDVNEKKIEKELSLIKEVAPDYIPILQNCNELVSWDMAGRNACLQRNSEETKRANEIALKNMDNKKQIVNNAKVGNKEIAELILFVTISFCLPFGIFVLLFDYKSAMLEKLRLNPSVEVHTSKTHTDNVNLIQISNNISSPTGANITTNVTEKTIQAIPPEDREVKLTLIEPEPSSELDFFEGRKWVQNFNVSGFSYDYLLQEEKVLIDILESKKIFEMAKTIIQKKQIAISTGYKYCVSTNDSTSGISSFLESKSSYSLIMQNSKSQETIQGLSTFLTAKEIHQFTHVPLATVYKKLSSV